MKHPTDRSAPKDSGISDNNSRPQEPLKNQAGARFILFRRLSAMPNQPEEMLKRLEAASGINQSDLRYRLAGPGFSILRPHIPQAAMAACIEEMAALGMPAAAMDKSDIAVPELPPSAKRVHLTDNFIEFQTAEEAPVLRIGPETELLVIATDLSGSAVRQIMTTLAYTRQKLTRCFEEALKKFSMSSGAAIFYDMAQKPPRGVFIDTAAFNFLGLNAHLSPSAAVNFRTMVDAAIRLSKTCATDHYFGIAALPGTKPDWAGGKTSIERKLGVYTRYMMTAWRSRLFTASDAAGSSTGERTEALREETWPEDTVAGDAGLEPPPAIEHSWFFGRLRGSVAEVAGTLIGLTAVCLFGIAGMETMAGHPRLWQVAAGLLISGGGAGIFCYSLLLLYYKRMVENTPTSKIRSHTMGMTELTGRARPYYDLRTAHTRTRCIFYECRYYRYRQTNEGQQWRLTRTVSSGKLPFYIEDETGRVLIHPKGAYFAISRARQSVRGRFIPDLAIRLDDPNTRVIEDLIPLGATIYVLGAAQLQRHGQTHRERLIDRLRNVKQDASQMARYDQNGDGHVDADEWDAARDDIERGVYADALLSENRAGETAVIEKPKFGWLPFIIADSEKGLITRFAIRSWLFVACGAVAFACGIGMLL